MNRRLRFLLWTVGALLLLLVVAIISLPFLIDPNDYREEIGALVKERTGRELVIRGDLELSLFPWLGVEAGAAQLGNAPGFGPHPFARFERARAAVKLLPLLLRREVELSTVEIDRLRLHLARNREGRTNWEDFIKRQAQAPAAPAPGPRGATAPFRLGGVVLRDAQLTWEDKAAGRAAEIARLNLTTGALAPGQPVTLDLDADFGLDRPQVAGHLAFRGTLHQDPEQERYRTEGLKLELDARGNALPGGAARVTLSGDAAADLKAGTAETKGLRLEGYGTRLTLSGAATRLLAGPEARGDFVLEVTDGTALAAALRPAAANLNRESLADVRLASRFAVSLAQGTVSLPDLRLSALGLQLAGEANGTGLLATPRLTGRLRVDPFVPRDLLARLGVPVPRTADATTLTKAALATRFDAGLDHAALERLELKLDQSTLTGRLALTRFTPPRLRYDLTLDQLDLDRYLPPPSKTQRESPATAAATRPLQRPLTALRTLDAEGTLRIGRLKAANLRTTDLHATLRASGGRLRLHPVGAALYQGRYAGDLGLDVRGERPRLSMDERLTGVQVGPLLQDFMGKPYVTGRAQLSARLDASGDDFMQIRRRLNGDAAFAFTDGTVNGINLGQLLREAYAKYKGEPAPPEETRKTDFAELRGTLTVKEGVARNKDLTARSPALRVTGEGSANLATEAVDYRVNATVTTGFRELAALQETPIPVRITGTFTQPRFSVDLGAVAEQRLRRELEGAKKKQEKNLQKQIDEKLKELLKQK